VLQEVVCLFLRGSGKLNGFLRCKCIERDYGPVYRSHSGSKGVVLSMVLSSGKSSVA